MSKSLGQIAYEAHCATSPCKKLITGAALPEWKTLNVEVAQAWEMAAEAVRHETLQHEFKARQEIKFGRSTHESRVS